MKKIKGLSKLLTVLALSSTAFVFAACGKNKNKPTTKPVDDDEKYDATLKMKYKVFNGEAEITQIDKQGTKLTIPSEIGGSTVTRVSCTYTDDELTEVEIPATLTYLTGNGFMNCKNLSTVTFTGTSTLTDIPSKAFLGTKISSITIPASVRSISFEAFQDIDTLTSVTFASGSKLQTIGPFAFYSCDGLTSITLPNNLTTIGESAFEKCENLSTFTNAGATKLETIEQYAFSGCNKLTALDFTSNEALTTIGANAFRGCTSLTAVTFDEALKEIGNKAFYNTQNITTLVLPKNLTKVGDEAFVNAGLTSIELKSSSDTTFGLNAFSQYRYDEDSIELIPLEKITTLTVNGNLSLDKIFTEYASQVRNSLTTLHITGDRIDANAYKGCVNLANLDIDDSIKAIGESAFEDCISISEITLSNDNLTEISNNTFRNCVSLKDVTLSNKVTIIRSGAFDGCVMIEDFDFSKITLIGAYAFRNTKVSSPAFSRNLQTIGENAFENCVNIEEVIINTEIIDGVEGGVSSTTIRQYAFKDCVAITEISLSSNIVLENDAFVNDTNVETLSVKGEYGLNTLFGESSTIASKKISTITIQSGTEIIETGAFKGCLLVEEINIPSTVKIIGDEAFFGCSGISTLVLPNTLEQVGKYAFAECSKLTIGSLPSGIVEISEGLFKDDFSIGTFTLNENVAIIGNNAFNGCTNLEIASLNNSIMYIGEKAFKGCLKLELNELPTSLEEIGASAFEGCLLVSVSKTNDELYKIGEYAFKGCQAITKFEFANDLGEYEGQLGIGILEGCTKVEELKIFGTTSLEYLFGESVVELKPILSKIEIKEGTTSLADNMFKGFAAISEVKMPTNSVITKIGASAFEECRSLTSIDISKVEIIGNNAFKSSGLMSITIPSNGIELGTGVFQNCTSLAELIFATPSEDDSLNIKSIPAFSFDGTILVDVELPDSVTGIGESAFSNIVTLNSFEIKTTSKLIKINKSAFSGCSNILDIYIPDGVNLIGVSAFADCKALRNVEFADECKIEEIENSAYSNCYALTTINLPNTIKTIGQNTFENCTCLVKLDLPTNLETIGTSAFKGCESLNEVVIPTKITTIPDSAFMNCYMLESVKWNSNIKTIQGSAFFNTPYKNGYIDNPDDPDNPINVRIPNTVSSIGASAFASEGGKKPVSFEGVTLELGNDAAGVSLTIGKEAFSKSGVQKVIFGAKVVEIGDSLFSESKIEKVDFVNIKITKISDSMFEKCGSLDEVIMEYKNDLDEVIAKNDTINTIGDSAFLECKSLLAFNFANILSIGNSAFEETTVFGMSIKLGTSTNVTIGDRAFYNSGILGLELGQYVIKLGATAFSGTKISTANLKYLNITEISASFFADCENLKTVQINNKIRTIGANAFAGTAIEDLEFLENASALERIMASAFEGCSDLKDATIPNSVSYVGDAAFKGCDSLATMSWSEGANVINKDTFNGCAALNDIVIPENVSRIEKDAFSPIGDEDTSNPGTFFHSKITFSSQFPPSVDEEFAIGLADIDIYVPTGSKANYLKNYVFAKVVEPTNIFEY